MRQEWVVFEKALQAAVQALGIPSPLQLCSTRKSSRRRLLAPPRQLGGLVNLGSLVIQLFFFLKIKTQIKLSPQLTILRFQNRNCTLLVSNLDCLGLYRVLVRVSLHQDEHVKSSTIGKQVTMLMGFLEKSNFWLIIVFDLKN